MNKWNGRSHEKWKMVHSQKQKKNKNKVTLASINKMFSTFKWESHNVSHFSNECDTELFKKRKTVIWTLKKKNCEWKNLILETRIYRLYECIIKVSNNCGE